MTPFSFSTALCSKMAFYGLILYALALKQPPPP